MSGPFVVLFAVLCTILVFGNRVCCNDTSGTNNFFLKTARGRVIPRISGRDANNRGMNPLERIFLKASKSIPRIGRTQQSAMEVREKHKTILYPILFSFNSKELHKQEILFLPYFNPQDEYQNKLLECKLEILATNLLF